MNFDFDTLPDLENVRAAKWDSLAARGGAEGPDAIAMWVADMDFTAAPAIREAIAREAEKGYFGYFGDPGGWREAQQSWLEHRHGWRPEGDAILPVPGILFGLFATMQIRSEPGDAIALFSPVYHEFRNVIEAAGRRVHFQPMIEEQGRYRMDVEGLGRDMPSNTSIVLICSPHNPSGRVWSHEELLEVADFCAQRNLTLVSDEIHYDLVYPGSKHLPMATVAPHMADRLVTLLGATKSFNIAGAKIGAAIVEDLELRKEFLHVARSSGTGSPSRFGMVATEAAQRGGGPWIDAVLKYLEVNRDHLAGGIARAVPGARAMHLEATYLGWVDFTETGLSHDEVLERITKRARIGVSQGRAFGPGGENRFRMNFAVHRSRLEEALSRLADAFSDLR